MTNYTKQLVKARKKEQKEFKALYNKARKTIAKLKEDKPTKQTLLDDLTSCNNIEIMQYIGDITPQTKAEYIYLVNKALEFESKAHEYDNTMIYKPGAKGGIEVVANIECYIGGFEALTDHIRQHHNSLDKLNALREKIGLKKEQIY